MSKEVRTLKDPYDEEDGDDESANWRFLDQVLDLKILSLSRVSLQARSLSEYVVIWVKMRMWIGTK